MDDSLASVVVVDVFSHVINTSKDELFNLFPWWNYRCVQLLAKRMHYNQVYAIPHWLPQPTNEDNELQTFIASLQLAPIPNTTTFSRHGGPNYKHTSLIDGFYTPNNYSIYHICNTNMQLHLNSDHFQ